MHQPPDVQLYSMVGAALETSNVCRMEDIDTGRPAMLDKPKENPDVQGSGPQT